MLFRSLPDDSSVKVASEGLLGGSYLSVSPGGSDGMMKEGDEFGSTQGSIDLLGLISKAMFSGGEENKKEEAPPAAGQVPAPLPAPTP